MAFGCQWLVSYDGQQCDRDADCTARGTSLGLTTCVDHVCRAPASSSDAGTDGGEPSDPKWGCLGKIAWGAPAGVDDQIIYRLRFVTLLTEEGIPGLVPRACKTIDAACSVPISTADAPSDADGYVSLRVPRWFNGYVEVSPPASSDLMPLLVAITPSGTDSDLQAVIPPNKSPHMFTAAQATVLAAQAGATYDATLGALFFQAQDCSTEPTAGVSVTTSTPGAQTTEFYLLGSAPSASLTATSESGVGVFANLPPGFQTIRYALVDGRSVGTRNILSRAGWITFAALGPSP